MPMKQKTSSVDWLTLTHFLEVGRKYRPQYYFVWLTAPSAVCISTLVPFFVGKIIATLARPQGDITPAFIGLAISGALTVILNRITFNNLLVWQPRVMADLQTEAFESLIYRGTSFHNNQISGKIVSDALDYPTAFVRLADVIFITILPFFAVIVTGILLISVQSPLIGGVVLLMTIVAISSAVIFRRKMTPFRQHRMEVTKAVTAHIADTITNNQNVKSFSRESFELETHKKLNDRLRDARLRDWHKLATNGNNRIIGLFAFELLFILTIIQQIHHHPALLATGIFAFSYTVTLTNRLFDVGTMLRTLEESLLLAEPMTLMLREQAEVRDNPEAKELIVNDSTITFNHVTFAYHDNSSAEAVFSDLNFTIKAGERVGLVGPSGGGKSTLVKLLLRFEDITSGEIVIDHENISQVTQQSLRESIGYVTQEPLLFHRTVKENIAYGNPRATQEDIIEATKKAYALDFIKALPNGFDTIVGERGVKLSGGQKQRVAIARALLKNAPILLLDEATSALDSESEQVIQKALWQLMKGKTAIVIAHRLSTIQKMDRIIVLDEGKIIEEGSHKALLENNGLYARLWTHQSGGFIEE
jgi:ATP-binding cassette subfamily B protein